MDLPARTALAPSSILPDPVAAQPTSFHTPINASPSRKRPRDTANLPRLSPTTTLPKKSTLNEMPPIVGAAATATSYRPTTPSATTSTTAAGSLYSNGISKREPISSFVGNVRQHSPVSDAQKMPAVGNGHGNTSNGGFTDILLLAVDEYGTKTDDEEVPCSSGGHTFSTNSTHSELMVSAIVNPLCG